MSLFLFLTVVQALVAAALVGVILMQRSEGGGLGVGGSPSGLMSARGAADFLTRSTAVLATAFMVLSIVLAILAVGTTSGRKLDTSLNRTGAGAPINADPLAGTAQSAGPVVATPVAPPVPLDPLAGQTRPIVQPAQSTVRQPTIVSPAPRPTTASVRPVRAKVATPKTSPATAAPAGPSAAPAPAQIAPIVTPATPAP